MSHHSGPAPSGLSRRAALGRVGTLGAAIGFGGRLRAASAQAATPCAAMDPAVDFAVGVEFGTHDGKPLLVDVVAPSEHGSGRPAVVLLHGGGMYGGTRSDLFRLASELAKAGYVTFNVGYRLFDAAAGTNPWPAQLDDVQRAVRWIRANADSYGIDPTLIGALGHSSGGQLAAFLGTRDTRDNTDPQLSRYSSRVACVVDLSGDMDLSIPYPPPFESENDAVAALLGGTIDAVPDRFRDFSPIAFVSADSAPFLILQGVADEAGLLEHSRRMTAALQGAGIEVIYGEFPRLKHLDTMKWRIVGPLVLAFLERHLRLQA